MTNATAEKVKKGERPKSKKGVNPYALPSSAQFFSYWQYRNSIEQPPDTWRIRHTWIDEATRDTEAAERLAESRKRDISSAALVKELCDSRTSTSFSKSRYVRDIRLLSTWRLLVGHKRDACIQLDQQLHTEYRKYLQLKQEYKECVNALEEFLSRDHEASMRVLDRADAELKLTTELSVRRDGLSRRYGQVRLEVYHWEEAWRTVRACHRFLHRVSPLGAHAEDDEDDDEEEGSNALDGEPSLRDASGKLTSLNNLGHATSLDSLIAEFEKEAIGLAKSSATEPRALGLVDANDLLKLFRDIELQNLNALIHLETLNGPMADMIARIEVAEVQVNHEIDDVLDGIKQLEKSIEIEEHRAKRLEDKASRLIQRQFRALICSEEALRARVLVEEAYESCVGPNEAGLEPLAMARELESAYERLSADLDGLPRHLVAICEREGFRQEMRENREAEDARQKYELMHRLLGALRRIMEQTKEPKRRMLMRRSRPKSKRKSRKKENLALTKQDTQDFIGGVCDAKRKDSDDSSDDND